MMTQQTSGIDTHMVHTTVTLTAGHVTKEGVLVNRSSGNTFMVKLHPVKGYSIYTPRNGVRIAVCNDIKQVKKFLNNF